jgi:hypothetical protein
MFCVRPVKVSQVVGKRDSRLGICCGFGDRDGHTTVLSRDLVTNGKLNKAFHHLHRLVLILILRQG